MDLMGAMIAAVALPLPASSLRLRDHRDYCVGRATARHLLEGDAKAGSAELREIGRSIPSSGGTSRITGNRDAIRLLHKRRTK
jgi:hypothetical protein